MGSEGPTGSGLSLDRKGKVPGLISLLLAGINEMMSGFVSKSTQRSPTQSFETLTFSLRSSRYRFSPVAKRRACFK